MILRSIRAADILSVVLLAVAGMAASLHFSSLVAEHLVDFSRINFWFDGDSPRVFNNLTGFGSNHDRTQIHPASSILTHPPVELLSVLGGLSDMTSVRLVLAVVSGGCLGLIYAFARVTGVALVPATLFSAFFGTSAAFVHWSGVPELFLFSAFTISLLLLITALGRSAGQTAWVLSSALTLSITVTNWIFGIISTYFIWDRKAFLKISILAFLIICVFSGIQYALYANAKLFFNPLGVVSETKWTQIAMEDRGEAQWTPLRNLWSLLVTTIIAPVPEALWMPEGYTSVNNHFSSMLDAPVLTQIAAAAWIALFAIATYAALALSEQRQIVYALVLMLAGQAMLHLVYGFPTFLFGLHFLPVLTGFVILAFGTKMRTLILCLTSFVCVTGGVSNYQRFLEGVEILERII